MAQTHLAGWVVGQRPGCVFGSLSKQCGASPAVLCKHTGPDPERSEEFSLPGFTAGLAARLLARREPLLQAERDGVGVRLRGKSLSLRSHRGVYERLPQEIKV